MIKCFTHLLHTSTNAFLFTFYKPTYPPPPQALLKKKKKKNVIFVSCL